MHAQNYWTKHNINKKLHFLTEYLSHWYFSSQDRLKRLLVPRISVRGKTNDDGITHLFFSKNNFCWSSTFDLSKARSKLFGWIDLDLEVLTASSFVSALEPLSVPLPLLSCGKHVPEPCESSTLRFFYWLCLPFREKLWQFTLSGTPTLFLRWTTSLHIINRSLLNNQVLWTFRKVMCIKTIWSSSSTCVTEIWINLDVNIKFKISIKYSANERWTNMQSL